MSKIKIKARMLKDAAVEFISVVDNPASQIPFRVLKRDTTTKGIFPMFSLNSIRAKKGEITPAIVAVVCRKQDEPAMLDILALHDLSEKDKVEQDDILIFKQADYDDDDDDITAFSIGDNTAVLVSHVQKSFSSFTDSTMFSENLQANGFFPSFRMGMDALSETTYNILYKSEDKANASELIQKATGEFGEYVMALMTNLPEKVFKMAEIEAQEAVQIIKQGKKYKKKEGDEEEDEEEVAAGTGGKKKKKVTPKKVAKGVKNDPRPEDDPAAEVDDNSLAPNQQAAGEAAAEACEDEEGKEAAYNTAAAETAPEWPEGHPALGNHRTVGEGAEDDGIEADPVEPAADPATDPAADPAAVAKGDKADDMRTMLTEVVGAAIAPIAERLDNVEAATSEAVSKTDKLKNTVLNADKDDTLSLGGLQVQKSNSVWDGSGLDNLM